MNHWTTQCTFFTSIFHSHVRYGPAPRLGTCVPNDRTLRRPPCAARQAATQHELAGPRAGFLLGRESLVCLRVQSCRECGVECGLVGNLEFDQPTVSYGSVLTRSGCPSNSPFAARTFAVNGAKMSETLLVDSTSPSDSPAVTSSSTAGAGRTRRHRAATEQSR